MAPPENRFRMFCRRLEETNRRRIRLEKLTALLHECFKTKVDGSGIKTVLGFDLAELDKLVQELAAAGRVRLPITLWDAYKSVNRSYRRLKLIQEIESLILRAVRGIPVRPLTSVARLARGDSELAKSAQRLIEIWPKLRRGEENAETVNWREFETLFIHLQNLEKPVRKKVGTVVLDVGSPGSPELIALCAYQKLAIKDLEWVPLYFDAVMKLEGWVSLKLRNPKLAALGEPLFNLFAVTDYSESVAKLSLGIRHVVKKRSGRMRKQRQRKNLCQKTGH